MAALSLVAQFATACPYCSRLGSTITLDVEEFPIVVFGVRQPDGTFEVHRVLKGDEFLDASEAIAIPDAQPNLATLAFGESIDGSIAWTKAQPIEMAEFRYLLGALDALAQDPIAIRYFYPYLGDRRPAIADDAFYQFARTDYAVLDQAKGQFDRDHLLEIIASPDAMSELRELAYKLLGMVGNEGDAHLPLAVIQAPDAANQRSLKTLIASYLALAGDAGLQRIENEYLANLEAKYELTHAAIEAIRFHLEETNRFERRQLLDSLHIVLGNAEISDVVLPDLINAKDWTAIEKVAELFRNARADQRWVRVAAAKYLLAAPPKAVANVVSELRELDSSAFVEAETGKPSVPTNTARDTSAASRSAIDLLTGFLASPTIAAATIASVMAMLAIVAVRFFSKKKP